jgi:putative ABC transport system permease protein
MNMRLARQIVRAASCLVPSGRRAEWRAEWQGELAERERRSGGGVMRFALGALPHAIAELRQEWNADVLGHELRYAARTQVRNPAYATTVSLLIALGVGANTTVFTLVNAVLLRAPSGITDPNRLVQLGRTNAGALNQPGFNSWSYPLFMDFRTRNTSFVDLAAYERSDVLIGDDANVTQANAQLVSASYFALLGVIAQRGRGILPEDLAAGAAPVVVLSDALWQSRFGGDPNIVGKVVRLRGTPFRIVGIAPRGFTGTEITDARPDLWVPLTATSLLTPGSRIRYDDPRVSWLWIVGRLKPGVGIDAARAEIGAIHRGIQLALDDTVRDDVAFVPGLGLRPDERAEAVAVSSALLAMVGLVLLITCANLAALLLARGAAREGEIGVRLAIGAGRGRLVRQLLVETMLLAVLGSMLAFVATYWTARFVAWLMPYQIAVSLQPDANVLAYGLLVGVSTALAFGVVPALRSTRVDLLPLLRSGVSRATGDRGRLRGTLLVAQIALSFVLLGAAGLLARTVQRSSSVDPGFRTERVLVGDIDVRTTVDESAESRLRRLEALAALARQMPGVEAVSLASAVPTATGMSNRSMWRPDAMRSDARQPMVVTMFVDTAYLPMMGIPLRTGRAFDATLDRPGPPTAAVINETLAAQLWPGESAVGKQLAFGSMTGRHTVTVVGIARDTRNRSLRAPTWAQAYLLLSQNPSGQSMLHVKLADGAPAGVGARVSAELRALESGIAPVRFESVRTWMAQGYAGLRLMGILGAAFGALALLVASAGIYGVVSYESERRRREFGVRLALGARPSQVHAIVLWRSARLTGFGIVLGLVAFSSVAPLLDQWVFGISRFDPVTLATIIIVLLASAGLAAVGPAARAARTDPMTSLKTE